MTNTVIVDIEVLPGTGGDVYSVVDGAIEVIQASGLNYAVGPMGTTVEGDLDSCLEVAKAAHRACFVGDVERCRLRSLRSASLLAERRLTGSSRSFEKMTQ